MPLFGHRKTTRNTTSYPSSSRHRGFRNAFRFGRDEDRVAGGYKAALSNPNTTRAGRKHAKRELRARGRDTHVPLMTKIKRALGIRSSHRQPLRDHGGVL